MDYLTTREPEEMSLSSSEKHQKRQGAELLWSRPALAATSPLVQADPAIPLGFRLTDERSPRLLRNPDSALGRAGAEN